MIKKSKKKRVKCLNYPTITVARPERDIITYSQKKVRILVNTNADSTASNNSVMQRTFRKKKSYREHRTDKQLPYNWLLKINPKTQQ
jgi:hypothetical protein